MALDPPRGNLVAPTAIAPDGYPYLLKLTVDGELLVYLNGGSILIPHNLLDALYHPDTIANTPAKGDIIVGITQADTSIKWDVLPVGASGDILQSQADGSVAWVDKSTLGAMQHIETVEVAVAQASISFAAIPQTFRDLVIRYRLRSAVAATSDTARVQINADAGNNYDSCISYLRSSATHQTTQRLAQASADFAMICGANSVANDFGRGEALFHQYSDVSYLKCFTSRNWFRYAASDTNLVNVLTGGTWRSTAAISGLVFTTGTGSNWVVGSEISLYGVL